ncbi:hypothetical protein RB653_003880 [Dictyostelium firmibasis]|uniref:SAP domain-containing protein n=1 Tax=Dictyostelium firmibasis TaxID=79012 RepID=A0AAN7U5H1_9MYCE
MATKSTTGKQLLSNKQEDINEKLNEEQLENFTADCLKKYCKEKSIPLSTTKVNIIKNIIKYFAEINTTNNNKNNNNIIIKPTKPIPTIIEQQPIKSILKKTNDENNKENNVNNMNEIVNKIEKLEITKKKITTRKQLNDMNVNNNNKKVSFNPVNQIGFIERKEKNQFKYYINTNQNSPIKNESPLKIINNQLYNIFDCKEEEEEEFDTDTMSKPELKDALEKNGLPIDGDKQTLKKRLEQFIIETLNKTQIDHDNEDENNSTSTSTSSSTAIDNNDDWIRWTPLKAKYNKEKPTIKDSDYNSNNNKNNNNIKTIKSKPKPNKKLNSNNGSGNKNKKKVDSDDDDDYQINSGDGEEEEEDNQIMNSQQLFNAFLDVSISNKKKISPK